MAKKSSGVKVQKCVCSRCKQVANAAPHSQHAYCKGFVLAKPLPEMFAKLQGVKGFWTPVL